MLQPHGVAPSPVHAGRPCVVCTVVDDHLSWIAQICLPVLVGLFLLGLWYKETPRRTFVRFTMDNLKQAVAALFLHFVGVAVSEALFKLSPEANGCDWYFLFFIFDTCMGLFCTIGTHHVTARIFSKFQITQFLSTIGNYDSQDGTPGSTSDRGLRWLGQVLHYIVCSTISRGGVFAVLFALRKPLVTFITWVFSWQCTEAQKNIQLVIVLIIVPLIADGFQVATQNWWLKDRHVSDEGARPLIDHEDDFSLEEGLESSGFISLDETFTNSRLHSRTMSEDDSRLHSRTMSEDANVRHGTSSDSDDDEHRRQRSIPHEPTNLSGIEEEGGDDGNALLLLK